MKINNLNGLEQTPRLRLGFLGCWLLIGACYGGEFLQGLPCVDDADCGPQLTCSDQGLCGGLGSEAVCGNGLLEQNEECDDGNNIDDATCTADCLIPAVCGNGEVEPGEACDDGNTIDDETCPSDCQPPPECGNGEIELGEECDDGNSDNMDACTNLCRSAACGDGFVGPNEECDDANDDNTDACTESCSLAACGDGFAGPGEECDDGNAIQDDGCTNSCTLPSCIDGFTNGDESDIDCGGSCEEDCAIGQDCEVDEDCVGGVCGANNTCIETIIDVSAGGNHTCALLNVGVRCWGAGGSGQLGYGDGTDGWVEEPKFAGLVDTGGTVTQLVTGRNHTCVVLDDGSVRCWGRNGRGQLGYANDNYIGLDQTPASVGPVQIGEGVTQLTAGLEHTCARLETNEVLCWGNNDYGQLGYGHTHDIGDDEHPSIMNAVPTGGDVEEVIASANHTCVRQGNGDIRCWGLNNEGQLGQQHLNTIGDDETPDTLAPVDAGGIAVQLVLGAEHTCALLIDKTVKCWGHNEYGQLGYPDIDNVGDDEAPHSVGSVSVGGDVSQLMAGTRHTCALLDETKHIRCWGSVNGGRLGMPHLDPDDNVGDEEEPLDLPTVALGGPVETLSSSHSYTGEYTCAILVDGTLRCWGWNHAGQLGYGNTENIGDDEHPADMGPVPCLLP